MNLYTIDFETAYSKEYTLTKMSIEDYVADDRFQIIGVGIKKNNEPAKWYTPSFGNKYDPLYFAALLNQLDLPNSALLCHNTMFDGLILQKHFGIVPKIYLDTYLMAMPIIKPHTGSVSLKRCAEYFNLGSKGDEVHDAINLWWENFSKQQLDDYGEYCVNDVALTYSLYLLLRHALHPREVLSIDRTLRMYLEPCLELDEDRLHEFLGEVRENKRILLENLPDGILKEDLMSNVKLATVLRQYGVEPPEKISPTTGKATYAFAKSDAEFIALQDHEDTRIQAITKARIAVKSTLDETRADRLAMIARTHQLLRVPLLYYGAHTGRYAGIQKINLQNLPRGGTLRDCIVAPPGHIVIAGDLSQIEARLTAWFCNVHHLVKAFADKEDVYASFASIIYQKPVTKESDPVARFVGKTCILGLGYGMSSGRFKHTMSRAGIDMDYAMADGIVNTYRTYYSAIPEMWYRILGKEAIPAIAHGRAFSHGPVKVEKRGELSLPTAPPLKYPNLTRTLDDGWEYVFANQARHLFGGKLLENIIQSLARIIIRDALLRVYERYPVVMQVHDEIVVVAPENDPEAEKFIHDSLVKIPDWAEGLPIDAEVNKGKTYGDCK